MPSVGQGEALSVHDAFHHGDQLIDIKGEHKRCQNDEIGERPGKSNRNAGKHESQQNASHISHENFGIRNIKRQKPGAGKTHNKSQSHPLGALVCHKAIGAQKTEPDDPGDAGNTVYAVHEIEEIARTHNVYSKKDIQSNG